MSSNVVEATGTDPFTPFDAGTGRGGAAGTPVLDAAQRAVVRAGSGHGALLVLGGPGTGKSTVLVERAVHAVDDGADAAGLLLLAPSRRSATRLRDVLTARLDRTVASSPARSWQAYAFDLLRRARVEKYLALPAPPRLLSGAEQDQIIADLLSGHRAGHGSPLVWPDDLGEALGTRGFRQEVRQLFDRLTEYGLTAEDLDRLGRDRDRADWRAAARLYREYRDVLDLRMPEAFDPAGIITEARRVLQENPAFLAAERARLSLVLVDDLQEATPAIHELLYVIGADADIVMTASAESVVQGFRGARPDLIGGLGEHLPGLRIHALTTSWRLGHATAAAWRRVADRIPVAGGATQGRVLDPVAPASSAEGDAAAGAAARTADGADAVEAHVVASVLHEARFVSQRLLDHHLGERRPWASMAVIVRTGALLTSLARALTQQGIPVRLAAAERPVRDEVAVAALLDLYAVSIGRTPLTAELAVALLTSRFGGASALGLRRLRQQLRSAELEGGGGRASDDLLVESLQVPGALTGLTRDAQPARSIAGMLAAGTAAAALDEATPETVLWALWEASGAERRWVRDALAGGSAGERADRDLDAMMALFQTAERYVDQLPGASPAQFLDYVAGQEVPMDTLADRAPTGDAVELLTPASAAGREWDVVIVAGLQDGVWPNPRLRGELLGSAELVDILDLGPDVAGQRDVQARLRQVRHDELRSFSVAVSRARHRLICVGVDAEDDQPSAFLDLVDPWPDPTQSRPHTTVSRPVTLRALVAELRQFAQSDDPAERSAAVAQLARLAAVHATETPVGEATSSGTAAAATEGTGPAAVPGAHPDTWWGLLPLSTDVPIVAADETVTVSPSRITAVQDSPLNWFVQTAGGQEATDFSRSLGTLIHAIAERLPAAGSAELTAELKRQWPRLGLPPGWETDKEEERAQAMVDRFAEYVSLSRSAGRTFLHAEQDFVVELQPVDGGAGQGPVHAVLRGQVDRLEIDAEGRLFIADLKTGKHKPKAEDMASHPQLGAYQVAVVAGAFPDGVRPGGAALVNLGSGEKKVSVQPQEPVAGGDTWALDLVRSAASTMTGAVFESRHQPGEQRPRCTLPGVCPLCAAGRQVTE